MRSCLVSQVTTHHCLRSQDMGMLSLQGPLSRLILSQLTSTPLDNDQFPLNTNKMISVAGHIVRALRVSFVGEMGWELHIPSESCVPIYHALHQVLIIVS